MISLSQCGKEYGILGQPFLDWNSVTNSMTFVFLSSKEDYTIQLIALSFNNWFNKYWVPTLYQVVLNEINLVLDFIMFTVQKQVQKCKKRSKIIVNHCHKGSEGQEQVIENWGMCLSVIRENLSKVLILQGINEKKKILQLLGALPSPPEY